MTRELLIALTCAFFASGCSNATQEGSDNEPTIATAQEDETLAPVQRKKIKNYDGPFGLEMGLGLEEVQMIVPSLAVDDPGIYTADNVPVAHAAFESYILQFSQSSGLCALTAIGKDIDSGQTGSEVRSRFESLAEGITAKYGQGKKYDFATGLMDGHQYWMIALSDKNRTLAQFWNKEAGSTMPDDLSGISLQAHALNMRTGYVNLRYEFANVDDCINEAKARENQAL